ncbi:MAG: tetratricopeptide repeat protein [Geobacter sp.]|nr:MAG: tetratricopeptide repeat protein [Geobacter sp.]
MKIVLIMAMFLTIAFPTFGEYDKEAAYLRQGTEQLGVKNYQRAAKAFREAVRLNPASVEAHRGLGMAYLKLGFNEVASDPAMLLDAAAAFREAVRLAPGSAQTRYHLGLAYLALHDKNGALREYESIKGLDATIAEQLGARISSYTPPISYRPETGRSQTADYLTRVTITGNQVFVPVILSHGDRTVEARLLLDTGASITVISSDVAEKLDISLERAPRTRAQVVGGGIVTGWHTRLDRMSAGPHTKTGIDVAVIPHNGGGLAIDGLLGMNFLRNYKYHIDFNNQVVNWAR